MASRTRGTTSFCLVHIFAPVRSPTDPTSSPTTDHGRLWLHCRHHHRSNTHLRTFNTPHARSIQLFSPSGRLASSSSHGPGAACTMRSGGMSSSRASQGAFGRCGNRVLWTDTTISARDAEIRANVYKSLLLNSLSLASIYVFDLLLSPLVRDQQKWLHRNVGWFYQVLWLGPVVGTSFYLNVCGSSLRQSSGGKVPFKLG